MTLARPGARPSMRRRPQKPGNSNLNRDSNAVRASVFETALELGITPDSTVANWIFNAPLEGQIEEEEEEELHTQDRRTVERENEGQDSPLTPSHLPSSDSSTPSKPPPFLSHLTVPANPYASPPTSTADVPTADSRRKSHGIHFKDISPELFIPLSSPALSSQFSTRQHDSEDSSTRSAASRPLDEASLLSPTNSITPWESQLAPDQKTEQPEGGYTSDGQGLTSSRGFFKGRTKSKETLKSKASKELLKSKASKELLKSKEPKDKEPKSPVKSKRGSNEGTSTDGEKGYLSDGAYISKKGKSKGAMSFFRRKNKPDAIPPLPNFPLLPSFADPRLRPPQPSSPNLSVESDPFSRPSPEMPAASRPSFPTHSRPGSEDRLAPSFSSTRSPHASPPSTSASLVPPAEPRQRTKSSPTAPSSSRISPPVPILVPPNTAGGAPAVSSPRGGGGGSGSAMRPRLPPPQMPPPSSPLPQLPPSPMSVQSQPLMASVASHSKRSGVTSAPQSAMLRPDSVLDGSGSGIGNESSDTLAPPRSAPAQQTQMRTQRMLPVPPGSAGQGQGRRQQYSAPLDAPYGWSGSLPLSDPPAYTEHEFDVVPSVQVRAPPRVGASAGAAVPRRESTRTAESSLSRSTSASGSGEGSSGSGHSLGYPESRYTGATSMSASYSRRESKASSAYPESRYTSMLTLDEGDSFYELDERDEGIYERDGDERGDDYDHGHADRREGEEFERGDGRGDEKEEEEDDDDDASVYPDDDNKTAGRRTMYLVEHGQEMDSDDEFITDEPFPF